MSRVRHLSALLGAAILAASTASAQTQQPQPGTTQPDYPTATPQMPPDTAPPADTMQQPPTGTTTQQEPSQQPGTMPPATTPQPGAAPPGATTQQPAPPPPVPPAPPPTGPAAERQAQVSPQPGAAVTPLVMMLVPVQIAQAGGDPLRTGCWARLYGRVNYSGDVLTLVGPMDLPEVEGPFDAEWDDEIKSLHVGPAATVTVYDKKNFRDPIARFEPGRTVPQISQELGFFNEIGSMQVSCVQPAAG